MKILRYRHVRPYEDSLRNYGKRLGPEARAWLERFTNEYYYNTLDKDHSKRLHKNPGKDGQGIWVAANKRNEDLMAIKAPAAHGFTEGGIFSLDDPKLLHRHRPSSAQVQEDASPMVELCGQSMDPDPEQALLLKEAGIVEEDLSGTSSKRVTVRHVLKDGTKIKATAEVSLYGRGRLVRDVKVVDSKDRKVFLDSDDHLKVVNLLKGKR